MRPGSSGRIRPFRISPPLACVGPLPGVNFGQVGPRVGIPGSEPPSVFPNLQRTLGVRHPLGLKPPSKRRENAMPPVSPETPDAIH